MKSKLDVSPSGVQYWLNQFWGAAPLFKKLLTEWTRNGVWVTPDSSHIGQAMLIQVFGRVYLFQHAHHWYCIILANVADQTQSQLRPQPND
jgi:hypothetical protein